MAKITGIEGVFFKSKGDPAALAAWYQKHLGMPLEPLGGSVLRWRSRTPSGSPPTTKRNR